MGKPRKSRVPMGHTKKTWLLRVQTATEVATIIILPGGKMVKALRIARSVAGLKLGGG